MTVVNVYVLACGEYRDGHHPVSAHSTLAGAKSALRRRVAAPAKPMGDGQWMASENRVDEYWIYRLPVDGKR